MDKTTLKNGKRHHSDYNLAADYRNIKEALASASEDVKGRFGEIFINSLEDVKTKSTDVQGTISDYITHKPFKSVGIAIVSGLFLGLFLRRK